MSTFLKTYLHNILFGKSNWCSLCFKIVTENAVRLVDDVEIKLNNSHICVEMSDILCSVLGAQVLDGSVSEFVCNDCTERAIDSYTFMEICKENSEFLNNTIQSLNNGFNVTTDQLTGCNTLFLTINTSDFSTNKYYDHKRQVSNNSLAFKRFQAIIKPISRQHNITFEVRSSNISPKRYKKPKVKIESNKKKRIKKEKVADEVPRISIHDILFNANDPTDVKCKECLQIYSNLFNLKQHYIRVHSPKAYQCPECPRSYATASLLGRHKYESHCEYICSECGKTFRHRHTWKMHEFSHKMKVVCQDCGRVYKNKNTYKKHKDYDICGQKRRKAAFQGNFVCDTCNKRFCRKTTLRVHIKFEHGNSTAYVCPWCNKRFCHKSRLECHIVKHTQDKKFSCELCGGKFVTKASLLYHTRIHTGEKPYGCEMCDQRFLSSSRRADHVRRHHIPLAVECDICKSTFKSRASLLRHKKRHFNPKSRLHYLTISQDSVDNRCEVTPIV